MVLCSLMKRKDSTNNPDEEEFELPEKFRKLEKFFDDLKTDYGQRCIFDDLATEAVLDVFILATRWGSASQIWMTSTSIRASSRRKGVGQHLVTRALEGGREEGVGALKTNKLEGKVLHILS